MTAEDVGTEVNTMKGANMTRYLILLLAIAGCGDLPPLGELPPCPAVPITGRPCPGSPSQLTCETNAGPVADCSVTLLPTTGVELPGVCVVVCGEAQ